MKKAVHTLEEAQNERDLPMRKSLSKASFDALGTGQPIRGYVIVVALGDGSMETHWDTGGEAMRLLGALDLVHARIVEEVK